MWDSSGQAPPWSLLRDWVSLAKPQGLCRQSPGSEGPVLRWAGSTVISCGEQQGDIVQQTEVRGKREVWTLREAVKGRTSSRWAAEAQPALGAL